MSYYQGDYYRGDPGFFSFLGGIAKKAVGFIPGVGPALSTAIEAITPRASSGIVRVAESGNLAGKLARVSAGAKQVIAKHPVLSAAGAAGAIAGAGALAGRALGRRGMVPGMKRHRRMNPCNVRALRRAIRRAHGFERIARRVMKFTSPRKKGHFAGFRKARKRK